MGKNILTTTEIVRFLTGLASDNSIYPIGKRFLLDAADRLVNSEKKIEWYNDLLDMSVNMINDLEDQLPAPWILCRKKTPARGEVVEVTVKDGNDRYKCEAYIHAISGRWSHATGCGASVDGKVIAWRPKSEPYQGEE